MRAGVIDPLQRQRRRETWKRWERAAPMELWQLDVVHGFLLADGSSAKALTGIDDHSRYCVSARLMASERTQSVCDGFNSAMKTYGVPLQVLTDNGKVFTGRFAQPPVEVLFDRICRENGVDHILTQPRSPTTTGKIERFHRTLRIEFNTRQVFRNLKTAQEALDGWVTYYNMQRPHQALGEVTPESRFNATERQPADPRTPRPERNGEQWVCRRVASNGVVSVGYQQVSVGRNYAGSSCDVLVTDGLRRAKPYWGARRLALELARKGVQPAPSKSAVYRSLVPAGVIDPLQRQRRRETWKRWERAAPMELWQLDVVHGSLLADGSSAKALTGIDDHSRYCVSARLMASERTQSVCDGFYSAMQTYGVPLQVLTDNGKVFTGRFRRVGRQERVRKNSPVIKPASNNQ